MHIPLTNGLPLILSNLIRITPSSFTEALESINCSGLLAPTSAKISSSDRTCHIILIKRVLSSKVAFAYINMLQMHKKCLVCVDKLAFSSWMYTLNILIPFGPFVLMISAKWRSNLQQEDYQIFNENFPIVLIDR